MITLLTQLFNEIQKKINQSDFLVFCNQLIKAHLTLYLVLKFFFKKAYYSFEPKKNYKVIVLDNIITDVTTADRPLLKDGPEKLYELYEQRHQLYLQFCDYHIYNDGSLDEIVDKIIKVYQEQ